LDLLPDRLKLLRRQRSDLIQYSLGFRAHGFNLTCSAWKPQAPQLGRSFAQRGQRTAGTAEKLKLGKLKAEMGRWDQGEKLKR
jgi:hypothetical protein